VKCAVLIALVGCRQIYGLSDPHGIEIDADNPDTSAIALGDAGDPTLAAYWTFDALGNGVTPDVSGHGHDATCMANRCPTVVDGMFGNALSFALTPMTVSPNIMFAGDAPLSITAWIKVVDATVDKNACIVSQPAGIQLCIRDDRTVTFTTRGIGAVRSGSEFLANTWVFVAGVYAADPEVYIGSAVTVGQGDGVAGNGVITLGGSTEGDDNESFTGDIDNVRIYTRALDADEIAMLAAGGSP
jgi:hypothetical protein